MRDYADYYGVSEAWSISVNIRSNAISKPIWCKFYEYVENFFELSDEVVNILRI